jgi:hypothetical protein
MGWMCIINGESLQNIVVEMFCKESNYKSKAQLVKYVVSICSSLMWKVLVQIIMTGENK